MSTRRPSEDFNNLSGFDNGSPSGIWSDGTTMWVGDATDDKLYAYNLRTKQRDASKDFNTLAVFNRGAKFYIWSDGTTMWFSHFMNDTIYAYNLQTKQRDMSKDFNTLQAAGNTSPTGIWSDGTTMWIGDVNDRKIYAYNLQTKQRDMSKDFNTLQAAGNTSSTGIWSDGTTMWVGDDSFDKLFAYNLQTKQRDASKDFDTLRAAGNTNIRGLWSDGTTMWVSNQTPSERSENKIFAYYLSRAAENTEVQNNTSSNWDHVQEGGVYPIKQIYIGTTSYWQQSNPPVITAFTANPTSADLDAATGNVTLRVTGTGFTNGKFINKTTGAVVQNFATTTGTFTATTPIPQDDTTYTVVLTNATGATSQDVNFTVTKNPTISQFQVDHYIPGRNTHGITAVFRAVIDGRPQPTLSADQGIGTISTRHLTRRADGKWDLTYTRYFGTSGNRTVTLTATNGSGTVTAQTVVVVP